MENDIFYRIGKCIYYCRWFIIIFWIILLLVCTPFLPRLMDPFKAIGFVDRTSQSAKANDILNEKLGYSYNRFLIMYSSDTLNANEPRFMEEIKSSLKDLKYFPIKHQIIYPDSNKKQISADKHTAYAVVLIKGSQEVEPELLKKFKSAIKKPANLKVIIGGEPIFLDDTKKQTQIDLFKAEYIATPVAIITMLIVFGSVVAASLPIILTGVCALLILMVLFGFGHVFSLSVFTINIALLLGLCLSLDYSLLIINRYREELKRDHSVMEAIAITQATAGKSVFFSGLAVLISLSALLLFRINILFSVGMGGIAAAAVAVVIAVVLLPAILAIINHNINRLQIRFINPNNNHDGYWFWFISKVVNKPFRFFIACLLVLLLLGYPFLSVKFGISDFRILPKNMESRQVFDMFKDKFGENKLAPILVIIKTPQKNILTKNNINYLYKYADKLKRDPNVEQIISVVNTEPRLTKSQYEMLYTGPKNYLSSALKDFLQITTHENFTVMTIVSKYPGNTPPTTELIKRLRNSKPGNNMSVEITGTSVNTIDVLQSISQTFPYAFLWIIAFTYIVLLFLLRSVILPLKAILTTILSLCASYGVLVIIIQNGFMHELLNFEPQGMLDISLLIIIFCALFGISMDYEVFLLTRIKEYYERTGDTNKSIKYGIDRSSRIITSAAVIVILICFSFMSADILMVKAFGLGIAVAVFVDAFIIRSILVPATMAILGKWNWYLPKWLDLVMPVITFDPEHHGL